MIVQPVSRILAKWRQLIMAVLIRNQSKTWPARQYALVPRKSSFNFMCRIATSFQTITAGLVQQTMRLILVWAPLIMHLSTLTRPPTPSISPRKLWVITSSRLITLDGSKIISSYIRYSILQPSERSSLNHRLSGRLTVISLLSQCIGSFSTLLT